VKITSISILLNEKRIKIEPGYGGKFKVPDIVSKSMLTAKELVEHPNLKDMDPVITTDTGEKYRVYQGGDSTQQVVETISLIEKHDKIMKSKYKKTFTKEQKTTLYDSGQLGFPWDDFYGS
jgi:hypothetical protein